MKFTGLKSEVTVNRMQKYINISIKCAGVPTLKKGLGQLIHASMKVKDLIAPITGTLLISVFAEN